MISFFDSLRLRPPLLYILSYLYSSLFSISTTIRQHTSGIFTTRYKIWVCPCQIIRQLLFDIVFDGLA